MVVGHAVPQEVFDIVASLDSNRVAELEKLCVSICKKKYDVSLIMSFNCIKDFLQVYELGLFRSLDLMQFSDYPKEIKIITSNKKNVAVSYGGMELSPVWYIYRNKRIPVEYTIEEPVLYLGSDVVCYDAITPEKYICIGDGRHEFFQIETTRGVVNTYSADEILTLPTVPIKSKSKFAKYLRKSVYYNTLEYGTCEEVRY